MEHQINWIQLNSTLLKFIEKKGRRGQRPQFGDHVEIQTTFLNAEFEKEVEKLQIGYGLSESARLLELSALSMDEGEVSQFRAKLSTGEDVNYEINLIQIVSHLPHVSQWELPQLLSAIKHFKERGVALYKEKDIVSSFHAFSRALKLAIPVEVKYNQETASSNVREISEYEMEIVGLIPSLYNNLGACHLEQKNYDQVVEVSDQAMKRSPNDVKAIFRRSSALIGNVFVLSQIKTNKWTTEILWNTIGLHNYADASEFLIKGLQLDPNNKALHNLKLKNDTALRQQDKAIAGGMRKYFQ